MTISNKTNSPLYADQLENDQLAQLKSAQKGAEVLQLFAQEPERARSLILTLGAPNDADQQLAFDFSKHPLARADIQRLLDYAQQRGFEQARQAMLDGEAINYSEGRAVMHMALRAPKNDQRYRVQGQAVGTQVHQMLERMYDYEAQLSAGQITGVTGKRLTQIINIGIGGSDLGPMMVVQALRPYMKNGVSCQFISNVDPSQADAVLEQLDPERCLFIVASKTFTTQETLLNAQLCRDWLRNRLGQQDVGAHFAAVSSNVAGAQAFGIAAERVFGFWDWVGGRYSLWSAVGLSILLSVGKQAWQQLLAGAFAMDENFVGAAPQQNIALHMAVLAYWYRRYAGVSSHAILPYDQNLARLPAYLQQLEMESNGKSIMRDGSAVGAPTGQVLWGEPGTNGQHSFYQLLHQGTDRIACDLFAAACSARDHNGQHSVLLANFLAQGQALMQGQSYEQALERALAKGMEAQAAHNLAQASVMTGARPVTSVIYPRLTPWVLGAIIAAYEHKTFTLGFLFQINAFDQMGVELGKVMANSLHKQLLAPQKVTANDASTNALANQLKDWAK